MGSRVWWITWKILNMRNSYWESIFLMYYIILNNFYLSHFLIWTCFAYQNRHWKIALTLIESKNKFQFFVFFIVSSAASWRADSKNVNMSIANIVLSLSKMWKTSGKVQFSGNCKFPEVFFDFDSLRIIFAMDIYTFLESARQGAAIETIKKTKSWNIFFDSMRASAIFQWQFW